MAFSPLPLAYCTNVHPCRAVADVPMVLDRHALAVREQCGFGISVGLWLPEAAVADPAAGATAADALACRLDGAGHWDLRCLVAAHRIDGDDDVRHGAQAPVSTTARPL